ncbi:hypothetical protein HX871_24100, partial [Pseudomonas reactans]|nr:hypothetical protein [Pseudomonas reactans]
MVSVSGAGHWGSGVRFDTAPGKGAAGEINSDSAAGKDAVTKLLKELDDAQSTGKDQTVRDLRNKLHDMRQDLGDEKLKEIIEKLRKDASSDWLAWLKKLFPDLFPDGSSPSPSPSPPPDRGGGG